MATSLKIPTYFTAIDNFSAPISKMERKLKSLSKTAMDVSKKSFLIGSAIALPLIVATNNAIAFEDRMADVAKTTGLAGNSLDLLGKDLLKLSTKTRTPIEDLQKISEIGGQLGIQGREGIVSFTDSVNKFNVALGGDFQGGVEEATRSIGSLNVLFKETRGLDIADSITRAGSAINALSAKGVQVAELTEFTKRLGQLPDAIKPTIQETIALGAVFNKSGISAEIAARGLGDVLITASQNAPKFARQMGISTQAVINLLNTNPTEFLKQFSASLKGIDAGKFAKISKNLKLSDVGSIKVVGSLSSSLERLNEFQSVSNTEFTKATSLLNEYNTKNATTAANIAIAKNNMEAFSITIGTKLIPVVNKLLNKITPIIEKMIAWTDANPELTKTILKAVIGVGALVFAISGIAFVIAIALKAILAYSAITKTFTAIQWALNLAMLANPLGVFIVLVAIVIGFILLAVKYWDSWGASITAVLGILGIFFAPIIAGFALIVSIIQSFRRNWDMITKAFTEGGILSGIMAIGKTLLDVILYPLQQILEIVAKVTGFDWAANAAKGLEKFRGDIGLNVSENNKPVAPAVNPKEQQASMMEKTINNNKNEKVTIDFKNMPKWAQASRGEDSNSVIPSTGSTFIFGQ